MCVYIWSVSVHQSPTRKKKMAVFISNGRTTRGRKADTNKCTAFCVAGTMKNMDEGQTGKRMMFKMHLVEGKRIVLGISPLEDIHHDCACGDKDRIQQCGIYKPERGKQGSIWKEILRISEHCRTIYYVTGVLKQVQWVSSSKGEDERKDKIGKYTQDRFPGHMTGAIWWYSEGMEERY